MIKSEKGFTDLVRKYEQLIYSICYLYSTNETETRDLVQDSLVNIWNGLDKFRGDSGLRTYVTRIVINTCISFKRKKKISTVGEVFIPQLSEEISDDRTQIQLLHKRMQKLDYLDRAVVLLWLEDMSYEEIGAIVGISSKNVGVRLIRIKNKLKNIKDNE